MDAPDLTVSEDGVYDVRGYTSGRSSGYSTEALRLDGREGVLWSPLWRLRVELTDLERALLQTWSVRRLGFLHHNGASVFAYPLNVSRLQHTLGVLALVTHFCPDNFGLRAAALLHDVGHFPFCHSTELVPGVDHHTMTRRRVTSRPIVGILTAHDLDPEHVLALLEGAPPNPLRTYNGLLHLDHLDSWVRQAQDAGYAERPAHELLSRLCLENQNVAADQDTAEYLVRLIRKGNERHYAEGDIGPAVVLAHMVMLAHRGGLITLEELADATDEALLAGLAAGGDARITGLIGLLREQPWRISITRVGNDAVSIKPGILEPVQPTENDHANTIAIRLDGLYDAMPLLAGSGQSILKTSSFALAELAQVNTLPGTFLVAW